MAVVHRINEAKVIQCFPHHFTSSSFPMGETLNPQLLLMDRPACCLVASSHWCVCM